jgi:hypothetical protein
VKNRLIGFLFDFFRQRHASFKNFQRFFLTTNTFFVRGQSKIFVKSKVFKTLFFDYKVKTDIFGNKGGHFWE